MNWNPMMGPLPGLFAGQQFKENQLGAGVTLGNPQAQEDYVAQLARALADSGAAGDLMDRADALKDSGWIDNSGIAGVAERMFNGWASKKMSQKARDQQADAETRRMTAQEQLDERKAKREAERASAARAVEIQAQIDAYNKNDPALDAALGIKREKPSAPDYVLTDMQDGSKAWIQKPGTGGPPARNTPTQDAGFKSFRDAIAGIESAGSGDYSAIGPQTKTGDRAIGRYQVMGANVPEWTKAALGRSMTPQEFAASPEAQDAVFDHRFGQYVQKYGPEGAAKAWFAGEGGMKNGGARDQLGTSVDQYGQKFMRGMGGTNEQYVSESSIDTAGVIPIPGSGARKEQKPSTIQQRQRDLSEMKAAGVPLTNGMAQYYLANGKMPDAPAPAAQGAGGMSVDKGNKVGLLSNALRSAREWHDIVTEKGADGRPTGGYNNMAARSPQAQMLLKNAIRAKLRAESGANIPEAEEEAEVERYTARLLGSDATDLGAANNLLNDLSTQIKSLVGSGNGGGGHQVGQIIEKGGRKYRVVGGDPNDPDVEEVR